MVHAHNDILIPRACQWDCNMLWHAWADYLRNLPCRACRRFIRAKQSRGEVRVKLCESNKTFVGSLWVSMRVLGVVQMLPWLFILHKLKYRNTKRWLNESDKNCVTQTTFPAHRFWQLGFLLFIRLALWIVTPQCSDTGFLPLNLFGVALTGSAKGSASFFV